MTDSKYFTTTKKGEIYELKSELNNDKKEKKKEAVKKVFSFTPNKHFDMTPIRYVSGYSQYDSWEGCFGFIPRCGKLHANR